MTQKSPSKQFLLHPIENHRNLSQLTKDSITDFILIQNNTEEIQLDRAIDTNTSYYAEQLARTIDQGNDEEDLQGKSQYRRDFTGIAKMRKYYNSLDHRKEVHPTSKDSILYFSRII